MAKKFEVIISENVGKTILVEANSADEAWELVDNGNWDESMVIKKSIIEALHKEVVSSLPKELKKLNPKERVIELPSFK